MMLHFVPDFFVLIDHHSLLIAAFDAVSWSKVLSIISYHNLLLIRNLNSRHKDCLIYSGGANIPITLPYNLTC